jgi:hypothetical protein
MESKAGSKFLFCRASFRKTASHFSGRTLVEAAMKSETSAIPPVAHRVFVMAESLPLKATTSPVLHRRCQAFLGS